MPRLLFLVSSAREIAASDGSMQPTGYFAIEAAKPYERFLAAGVDVVVATPDGAEPYADPYGLEFFFHYPDDDADFLASVTRTFAHDVDDIRLTLRHLTELDIAAARRVFLAMRDAGTPADDARDRVARAAEIAWRQDRNLGDVLVEENLAGPLTRKQIDVAIASLVADSQALSDARKARLEGDPAFQRPVDLSRMTDEEMVTFDGVFVPGGHGPMVDLAENADVERLLQILQRKEATIASLCHGPAALLAGGGRDDGQWLFEGYRMTCFTDEEEDQTRLGKLGMPWYLDTALKNAGSVFDDAPAAWVSHVVVDRNVITGQNPSSSDAVADAVLKQLQV